LPLDGPFPPTPALKQVARSLILAGQAARKGNKRVALFARFHAWRDRRRVRRHEERDERLIALSHDQPQDRHGKKRAVDIETAVADHFENIYGLGAGKRWAEDEFDRPSN